MKATPEQWANMADAASDGFDDGYGACLLELRARVEALEADQRPIVLTQQQHDEIADLLRPNSAPAINGPLLVTRVAAAISEDGKPINWTGAYAAVREVAAWLREEGYPSSPSRLEREVEQ
jgi:hypothetical protein